MLILLSKCLSSTEGSKIPSLIFILVAFALYLLKITLFGFVCWHFIHAFRLIKVVYFNVNYCLYIVFFLFSAPYAPPQTQQPSEFLVRHHEWYHASDLMATFGLSCSLSF